MATKVILFQDWIKARKSKGKDDLEPYATYLRHVLLASRKYPPFYSEEDAKADLAGHLDSFATTLSEKLTKPPKPGKGGGAGKKGGAGAGAATGAGGKGGKTGGKDDGDTGGGKGGKGGKSVRGGKGNDDSEGNQIALEKKKPDPYDKKPEYGDMDLRRDLIKMPKNPDLSMKAEAGDEMVDDRKGWGGVRLGSSMEIDAKNMEAFAKGRPGSIWLGFIRIGSRVGQKFDKLVMVELSPEKVTAGNEYAFSASQIKSNESWHALVLNKKFAETKHKINVWNGIPEKEMKAGKIAFDYNPAGWIERIRMYKTTPANKETVKELESTLPVEMTGCFFGFFLVKAADGGKKHYWNFKCASLNKWANGTFIENGPLKKLSDIDGAERAVYTNMLTAVRNGFGLQSDLTDEYKGYEKGFLGVRGDSKLLPLSWATAVIKLIAGGKDDGGNAIKEKKSD